MERLITIATASLILAVSILCFTALMQVEQATAQNVESIYLSIHGGGK